MRGRVRPPSPGLPSGAHPTSPENAGEPSLRLPKADPFAAGAVRIDTGDRDGHAPIREAFAAT
ncbi:hypothetical protein GCM10010289_85870 [Streptomyces violascens]|nr:hypothetical protein GCM10010289_85870 [Streptomyces violascens]